MACPAKGNSSLRYDEEFQGHRPTIQPLVRKFDRQHAYHLVCDSPGPRSAFGGSRHVYRRFAFAGYRCQCALPTRLFASILSQPVRLSSPVTAHNAENAFDQIMYLCQCTRGSAMNRSNVSSTTVETAARQFSQMNTLVIVQARLGSQRLPRKVLRELTPGVTMLDIVMHRVSQAEQMIDGVVVATTTEPADNELADYCKNQGWSVFRGSESDVLSRYMGAADMFDATTNHPYHFGLPDDRPSADGPNHIHCTRLSCCDYASNVIQRCCPRGLDIEVFTRELHLRRAFREATRGVSTRTCDPLHQSTT